MLGRVASILRKRATGSASQAMTIAATVADYLQFFTSLESPRHTPNLPSEAARILRKLKEDGICVIGGFWGVEACLEARDEVDRILEQYPEYINPNAKADFRIYGANNISNVIASFAKSVLLENVASGYNAVPTRTAFTLAAKMLATSGNRGSGEGWHRDAFFRQFKAIIYLSDVEIGNGPFQFIAGSHRLGMVLKDIWRGRLGYMQYRIREDQVDAILKKSPSRLKTFAAKAGTLILVDTSSIHRGMPIEEGSRYALTNYYFPEERIGKELYAQFAPIPGAVEQL